MTAKYANVNTSPSKTDVRSVAITIKELTNHPKQANITILGNKLQNPNLLRRKLNAMQSTTNMPAASRRASPSN